LSIFVLIDQDVETNLLLGLGFYATLLSFYQFPFFIHISVSGFYSPIVHIVLEFVIGLIFAMIFFPCSGFFFSSFRNLLYLACNRTNPTDHTENRTDREPPKPNMSVGGIGSSNVMFGFIYIDKFRPEPVRRSVLLESLPKMLALKCFILSVKVCQSLWKFKRMKRTHFVS
jgi:hypothetical protein